MISEGITTSHGDVLEAGDRVMFEVWFIKIVPPFSRLESEGVPQGGDENLWLSCRASLLPTEVFGRLGTGSSLRSDPRVFLDGLKLMVECLLRF